ncbi:MAG: nucleoside-triphosphatase [Peptococcaceae bacterium]|jgi:nucleoside-triphosphatase|nr:nucleoside-triphosphatase [Peptococcaceae bacterium]
MTKAHLFLTGEIQIGKSTALRRFLASTGIAADGFLTYFEPAGDGRDLFIARLDTAAPESPAERRRAAHITGTGVTVFNEAFDTYGADFLSRAGRRDLILMDELGAMEENAPRFKDAVLRRLNGDIPAAGVVKQRKSPFLDAIRAHPNVEVVTVTLDNRDDIPEQIRERVRGQ